MRSSKACLRLLVGLALCLHQRVAIDVHRGRDLGVPHEFLLHSHRCSGVVQPGSVRMPEGVPTDAAVLAGSIPPLIVQRQALPVRNGKVSLAPLTCNRPTVRAIHETATGGTNVVLSDWRSVEMPSRHGTGKEQVRLDDPSALVAQLG